MVVTGKRVRGVREKNGEEGEGNRRCRWWGEVVERSGERKTYFRSLGVM